MPLESAWGILRTFQDILLDFAQLPKRSCEIHQTPNSSGTLWFTPPWVSPVAVMASDPGGVFVTGATGYVGAHIVGTILKRTNSQVYCLVRGISDDDAYSRLVEALLLYDQISQGDPALSRISAIRGDIGLPDFGLDVERRSYLLRNVASIYNVAADVRLVLPENELCSTNVQGVRHLLDFAREGGGLEFHHISTLAIIGHGSPEGHKIFDESCFDVGQSFRNSYEATKFQAEALVRQYALCGFRTMIYRLGDVFAHSRTGHFQRNATESQITQVLRAFLCSPNLTTNRPI